MWRARGLALDRCLPDVLAVPILSPDLMRQRIPSRVQVPGQKDSTKLTDEDKQVVYDAAEFVTGYLAQCLPSQVVESDAKLPGLASKLAVQSVGGEEEYVGSFDALARCSISINVFGCKPRPTQDLLRSW